MIRMPRTLSAAAIVIVVCASQPAFAMLSAIDGHVTSIQATFMPASVMFTLDHGDATCPQGVFLWWTNADKDNVKTVYATILSAFLSGKSIHAIYDTATVGGNGPGNCLFAYLYIIP